jgi:hypothetical protein
MNISRTTWSLAAFALVVCSLMSTGCRQMSHRVRTDDGLDETTLPPTPPEYRSRVPQLKPVPSESPYLPPPAPPSDSASRNAQDARIADGDSWLEDEESQLVNLDEDVEYFPIVSEPPAFIMERGQAAAANLSEKGRAAAQHRWERLPVIVPATPALRAVSAEEPALMPVPQR